MTEDEKLIQREKLLDLGDLLRGDGRDVYPLPGSDFSAQQGL
jgi:hypothetical protein